MPQYSASPTSQRLLVSNWQPPTRVTVIALVGSARLTLGAFLAVFNPALLVGAGEQMNNAARVFAGYLVARNLSLAALLAGALALRARKALGSLIALTALIQSIDAAVDCYEQRWAIVPVVVVLRLIFLVGAGSTFGRPVWKIEGGETSSRFDFLNSRSELRILPRYLFTCNITSNKQHRVLPRMTSLESNGDCLPPEKHPPLRDQSLPVSTSWPACELPR